MNIGSKIIYYRKLKNINASNLAKSLDISQGYLSDLENNKKQPSIEMLTNICNALNITLSEFFNEDVDKNIDFEMNKIMNDIKNLDKDELEVVKSLINLLNKKKENK